MSFYKRFGFAIDPETAGRDHYFIDGQNYHAFVLRYSFHAPSRWSKWCAVL